MELNTNIPTRTNNSGTVTNTSTVSVTTTASTNSSVNAADKPATTVANTKSPDCTTYTAVVAKTTVPVPTSTNSAVPTKTTPAQNINNATTGTAATVAASSTASRVANNGTPTSTNPTIPTKTSVQNTGSVPTGIAPTVVVSGTVSNTVSNNVPKEINKEAPTPTSTSDAIHTPMQTTNGRGYPTSTITGTSDYGMYEVDIITESSPVTGEKFTWIRCGNQTYGILGDLDDAQKFMLKQTVKEMYRQNKPIIKGVLKAFEKSLKNTWEKNNYETEHNYKLNSETGGDNWDLDFDYHLGRRQVSAELTYNDFYYAEAMCRLGRDPVFRGGIKGDKYNAQLSTNSSFNYMTASYSTDTFWGACGASVEYGKGGSLGFSGFIDFNTGTSFSFDCSNDGEWNVRVEIPI